MAIFSHGNHLLTYSLLPAPFAADLVLLQGSRLTPLVWQPVLEEYGVGPGFGGGAAGAGAGAGGRILTVDVIESDVGAFVLFLRTLGLHRIHVVACEDAVALVEEVQRQTPDIFDKTLFFRGGVPKGEALLEALRTFCPAAV